jgi:superfamily II DNA or RNA helicase
MLFNWALGSGKTRGALKVVGVECPRRCTVVCTNTMIEYWVQETKAEDQKCENPTIFEVIGYTEFKRQVEDFGTLSLRDSFVILDEGHYFRNITESMKLPLTALLNAEQFILLTGTAIVNDPDETAFLSILFGGKNRVVNVEKLRDDVMDRIVSYHNPEDDPSLQKYFPTCSEQYIRVPMTWPQTLEYMMYRKSTGVLGGYKIKHGKLNSYNSTTRSISNIPFYILDDRNIQNSEAPKLRKIVNMVSKPNTIYPLVVFSHFKDMGVHAIKSALDSRLSEKTKPNGKKYIIKLLTGDTPASDRQKLIDNYNKNHIDILLLTEAAQLGINLLASGSLHICEPHKNSQTENQTKKRVSRYKSHMKCDHKHVNVFKYLSMFPKTISEDEKEQLQTLFAKQWLNMDDPSQLDIIVYEELKKQIEQDEHGECIDEKMEANNMRKQELLEPYLNAIKQASIEYHGFKSSEEKRFIEKKNHAENQKRKAGIKGQKRKP